MIEQEPQSFEQWTLPPNQTHSPLPKQQDQPQSAKSHIDEPLDDHDQQQQWSTDLQEQPQHQMPQYFFDHNHSTQDQQQQY
jgi:hypothetical protein